MKKSLLILGIIAFSFTSCKKEIENQDEITTIDSTIVHLDEHNAMNALDYQGVYYGVLPCADCEGMETTITLSSGTYIKEVLYRGKSKEIVSEKGSYSWNKEGNTIILLGSEIPNQYFVAENEIFHLDADGKRIQGTLASNYRLQKIETTTKPEGSSVSEIKKISNEAKSKVDEKSATKVELKNSKWRLIKMNGKVVTKDSNIVKEYGLIFTSEGKFSAYAGCNNMSGNYELKEDVSRIKFSKMISTMMACPDLITEQELGRILEITDNYNFDGKTLKLNRARMAPLAEFEIIK